MAVWTLSIFAALILLAPFSQAASDDNSEFHPYVGVRAGYDDNVLRLSDGEQDPAAFGDSDSIYTELEAGVEAFLRRSRQRFVLDANIYRQRYEDLGRLNHTGGDGRIAWNWAAGDPWRGTVGYAYDRGLRQFEDQENPQDGLRTTGTIYASVTRALSRNLFLELSGSHADVDIERDIEDLEVDRDRIDAKLGYRPDQENELGLEFRSLERDAASSTDNNDFTQTSLGPYLEWQFAAKTLLEAHIGYAERDADNPSSTDYEGVIGDATLSWTPTEKTELIGSLWREVSNLSDEIANFAIIHGLRVEGSWQATERIRFGTFASYEDREFRGQPQAREDDVLGAGADATWQFSSESSLRLSYKWGDRDSNRADSRYDYNVIDLELRFAPQR